MKKKLKKILKNKIFIFILGGIFFSTISIYAVTYFPSNNVTYDNKTSGLSSTDVQGAIDELYNTCSSSVISGDYIYFTGYSEAASQKQNYLYKVSINGGTPTEISIKSSSNWDYVVNNFTIVKDTIYFTGYSEAASQKQNYLYKVSINGGTPTEISIKSSSNWDYVVNNFTIVKDTIYFTGRNKRDSSYNAINHLYKVSINGGTPTEISIKNSSDWDYVVNNFIIK